LNARFPGFFDPANPIATGNTDGSAAIQNLSLPAGTKLPLILEVDGTNSTDLITDQTPVLKKLKTVITRQQIISGAPVYATPLSTITYLVAISASNAGSVDSFLNQLTPANNLVLSVFNFGINSNLNTFLTSPLIDSDATTVAQQRLAAEYRAANEALAAVVFQAANQLRSNGANVTEDIVLAQLARDLQADLQIDNRAGSTQLPHSIDLGIISANVLDLNIPNSSIRIRDIVDVLEDELQLGNSTATFLIPDYTPPITAALLDADIDNDGIVNSHDNQNGTNSNNRPLPGNTVLDVDFDNHPIGPYAEANIRSDFRVHTLQYRDAVHGQAEEAGLTEIVPDPANSGRGLVMRNRQLRGRAGEGSTRGGFRWRADLPPAEEYYFAYDFYVPSDWFQPLQHKMPGLINGTLLEASHIATAAPSHQSLPAFTAQMQSHSQGAFGRGDGSLAGYIYDKDGVQDYDWLNTVDPTSEANAGQYVIPKGQWVTIEQHMKLNTVNQRDGFLKIYINGILVSDQLHRWRADLSYPSNAVSNANRLIDGMWMYSFYGGNQSDPRNQPPSDQFQYYDNFIVSDSPITH
ncbi:hypothetical protein JYT96_01820, partial [Gammaproteobacteria bacterium AH-315-C21]|nr:hypothetical protein [Gammaproteobacteria bacterium AH-315-C21]